LQKQYLPFIGLRGLGWCCSNLYYRWRVIGSPFGWTDLKNVVGLHCFSATQTEIQNTLYTLNSGAARWLEVEGEAIYSLTPNFKTNFWLMGNVFRNSGAGNIQGNVQGSTLYRSQPNSFSIDNAKLSQSWYALGLALELSF